MTPYICIPPTQIRAGDPDRSWWMLVHGAQVRYLTSIDYDHVGGQIPEIALADTDQGVAQYWALCRSAGLAAPSPF